MNESDILLNYINKFSDSNFTNDDVAALTLSGSFIISSDVINEDIHFLASDSARSIAYRLINANLSDIYAKGAKPRFVILNLSFISGLNKDWYDEFFAEIIKQKNKHNFQIIGGDTAKSRSNSFSITIFAHQSSNNPKRENALANDDLYITNEIGGSFLGLNSISLRQSDFTDFYHFPKSTYMFSELIQNFANSSTDTSDGLYAALENIAEASNTSYEIDFKKLPFLSEKLQIQQFCQSDDYQILFSSKSENQSQISDFCNKNKLKLTKIGKITKKNKYIKNLDQAEMAMLAKFIHKL
jgi:thiamine-monophosphate kinase